MHSANKKAKNWDPQTEGPWRETDPTNAIATHIGWLRNQTKRETGPVGLSSKNRTFVTKN